MIVITQNETKVEVKFILTIGYNFTFSNDRQVGMDARLLKDQIQRDLNAQLEAIRKQAYELGWKDKSLKRKKKNWFSDRLDKNATPAL